MTAKMTENELVLLAKAGNEQALEAIIRKNLPAVYRLCLSILKDPDMSEDAAQESFVKMWRNLKKIDVQKNLHAWMMQIAKNTCFDLIKSQRNIPMSAFEDEEGRNTLEESLHSNSPSPAEMTEHSLLRGLLDTTLGDLSPAYQKVLNLYYRQGLNFREISEILHEPLHTVKSRHRRAIINLRLILAEKDLVA